MSLLIRVSRPDVRESPGARNIAAPLETEYEPYKQSLVRELFKRYPLQKNKILWVLEFHNAVIDLGLHVGITLEAFSYNFTHFFDIDV